MEHAQHSQRDYCKHICQEGHSHLLLYASLVNQDSSRRYTVFSADITLTAQVLIFFTSCICFIENKVRNTFRAIHIFTEVKIRNRVRFYHHFTEFKVRNKVRFDRLRHSLQKSFSEDNFTVTPDRHPGRTAASPNGPVFEFTGLRARQV